MTSTSAAVARDGVSMATWMRRALRAYQRLTSNSTSSSSSNGGASREALAERAWLAFGRVLTQLPAADLWSANETIRDIATPSLRYLLVHAYIAEVLLQWPGIDGRLARAQRALTHIHAFLNLCDEVHALSDADERAFERLRECYVNGTFDRARVRALDARVDPGTQRTERIAKFKRERELEQQLDAIRQRRLAHRRTIRKSTTTTSTSTDSATDKARGSDNNDNDNDDDDDGDDDDGDDDDDYLSVLEEDEQERELSLLLVQQAVAKSVDNVRSTCQELEFLEERERRMAAGASASTAVVPATDQRAHKPNVYTIRDPSELMNKIPAHMQQYLQHIPGAAGGTQQRQPQRLLQQQQQQYNALPSSASPSGIVPLYSVSSSSSSMSSSSSSSAFNVSSLSSVITTLDHAIQRQANARAQVFRDPNPATETIEEWAEEEIRRGNLAGPASGVPRSSRDRSTYIGSRGREDRDQDEENPAGAAEHAGEGYGEAAERASDEKQREAREWANWTDDHERGAGNKMGRR